MGGNEIRSRKSSASGGIDSEAKHHPASSVLEPARFPIPDSACRTPWKGCRECRGVEECPRPVPWIPVISVEMGSEFAGGDTGPPTGRFDVRVPAHAIELLLQVPPPSWSRRGSQFAPRAGMGERAQHLAAKQRPEHTHGEQVVRLGRDPALGVERQPTAGYDAMDVRVKLELARPGVQHRRHAELGVELPQFSEVRRQPATMAELKPARIHADAVVSLHDGEAPVLGVIVEVQGGIDDDKLWAWPAYATWTRRALRCDACVLVIAQTESVANWAARAIVIGPGNAFRPHVVRPSAVPVIEDVEEARKAVELAVLSSMSHGGSEVDTAVRVALAASTVAFELGRDDFLLCFGLIQRALGAEARTKFKMHPQGVRFFDESQQQSFDKGRASEKRADVLAVLEAREKSVTDAQRARIEACGDMAQLDRWLRLAATVTTADELFAD